MKVRIKLLTEMLGTIPKSQDIFGDYVNSKKPESQTENETATVENLDVKGWTGFHGDDNGLFIYEYMIKGFLKAAGNTLKDIVKIKALRSKIDDYVFIKPRRIYLNQAEPDGCVERPLRAMTPLGQRVSLAKSDYINAGKEIEFDITLIPHKEINEDTILTLLKHGELMGLGQFRNGGYGRFEVLSVN
jgi:hypothetical protein